MSVLSLHNQEEKMLPAPRSRRGMLVYLALLAGLSWTAFAFYTGTLSIPIKAMADLESIQGDTGIEEYGLNAQPEFTDVIQLMDLPADYLPQTGKHRHTGRLVVVGDVHGMKDSLQHLLNKIKFDKKHDHLILAGDMISKGPDSAGVVDLAMELGATGVRGNHEDRILLVHNAMVTEHADIDAPGPDEDSMKVQDLLEEESFSHGDYKDRKLARALGSKRLKWLKKCPVILRVGTLGAMGEVVVVHAGLAPGVELEKQDPNLVMNMRTIRKGGIPSDSRTGTLWTKPWNKLQKSLPHKQRKTAIYGHDSHRGLQTEKYSIGIDTGCLKGGKLTAVVIEGGDSDHTHKIVQVNCKEGR